MLLPWEPARLQERWLTWTFFLDPQNVYAPEEDPELKVEHYKRTFEQNEELGLNDMKTEGYEAGQTSDR